MGGCRILILSLSAVLITGCGGSESGCMKELSASLEMDDTTAAYDIWLTVRTPLRAVVDSLTLMMDISAPDGMAHSADTFVIPANRNMISAGSLEGIRSCSSVLSYDFEVLYRTGVRPGWPGVWKLSFRAEPPVVEEIWVKAEKKEN